MTISISTALRQETTKAAVVRNSGHIPAVVYGPKQAALLVTINAKEFTKLNSTLSESTIVALSGLATPIEVLVKDVAYDSVKQQIMHVDFYAIERGKEMTVTVPLHFIGESPVTKLGGVINKVVHEVTVTCLPTELPEHIDVDLSKLIEVGDHVTIADLPVAAKVAIHEDVTTVVATAQAVEEEVVADDMPLEAEVSEVVAKETSDAKS